MNVTRRNRATKTHRSEERRTATLTSPPARRQRQSRLPAGGPTDTRFTAASWAGSPEIPAKPTHCPHGYWATRADQFRAPRRAVLRPAGYTVTPMELAEPQSRRLSV